MIQEFNESLRSGRFKFRSGVPRKHGTNSAVVGTRLDGCIRFFKSMGADPDEQVVAGTSPCIGKRQVILAQVHAVGICGKCYVDPVIDDDTAPMRACHVDQPAGSVDEDSIGKILLT